MGLDLKKTLSEIDEAISNLTEKMNAGEQEPLTTQTLEVGGREVSFTSYSQGIFALTKWRMQLGEYQQRLDGNKELFRREAKEPEPRWTRYLTWICVALSLTGAALVSIKYPFAGSAVWVVANIGWLYDATIRKDRPQMLLWSAYLVTAVLGVWNWR